MSFQGDWLFNTDESEKREAHRKMLQLKCIAAWYGPNTRGLLAKPSAGDRVFFYLDGVGIIAKANFTDADPFKSNDIFGEAEKDEFHRRVVNLVKPKGGPLSFAFILEQTGYHLPVKGLALKKIHDSDAAAQIAELF
ncbi:hypothetical protein HYR99_38690 [Candidatus Poribacteria bacterium]|nr:hypothetical protein [Candidatus Poribacteria bacterium]